MTEGTVASEVGSPSYGGPGGCNGSIYKDLIALDQKIHYSKSYHYLAGLVPASHLTPVRVIFLLLLTLHSQARSEFLSSMLAFASCTKAQNFIKLLNLCSVILSAIDSESAYKL